MKKVFVLFIGLLMFQIADAQVKVGAIVGVSTSDISGPTDFTNVDSLQIQAESGGYGIHVGGYVHVNAGPIYVRAMPALGSSKIDYSITDFKSGRGLSDVKTETFLKLDLPVLVGMKVLKIIRVQAGPVGSVVLSSTDELASVDGLMNSWDGMTWGFQAGVGVNLKKLSIDINWEGGLSDVGDNITFANQSFTTDSRQNRWVVSLGYRLIGN